MSTTPTLSLDYVFVVTGESLVLESLFPRIQQMRALRRRLSDDLGVTGDEELGGGALPPPAKKKPRVPTPRRAAGGPTPRVPSPPEAVVASAAGGRAATPDHPPLEESDEGSDETLGKEDADEE